MENGANRLGHSHLCQGSGELRIRVFQSESCDGQDDECECDQVMLNEVDPLEPFDRRNPRVCPQPIAHMSKNNQAIVKNHESECESDEGEIHRPYRDLNRGHGGSDRHMDISIHKIRPRVRVTLLTCFEHMEGVYGRTNFRRGKNVMDPMTGSAIRCLGVPHGPGESMNALPKSRHMFRREVWKLFDQDRRGMAGGTKGAHLRSRGH